MIACRGWSPISVNAMFTNFPGRSGEEVRISIPPPAKK